MRAKAQKIVQEAILEHLDITPGKYKLTDKIESLGGDSLDTVQVLMLIEDELRINSLPGANKMLASNTINDIIDLVEKQMTVVQ
jgi:acyl carrier protein